MMVLRTVVICRHDCGMNYLNGSDGSRMKWLKSEVCARTLFAE